ncbi:MAG: ZIP family metal transporter [Verrucomicrobia bacterium]|jgi:zinc and cadmium transporter|nr:ZIP family metal transporter [Verrucomicrobiota bacterium]
MNTLNASPTVLLVVYCVLALLAALAGGALPTLFRLTHTRLQMAISFVGGLMLGLSLLGMMPHALHQIGSVQPTVAWLLAGFLMMFLLQRFLPFHHHDVIEGNPLEPCGHTHSLAERSARSLSWMGVALGLSLHSIFDGLAMAAAVAAGAQAHNEALGLGTALAVILHKPFGALAISTLMVASRASQSSQRWVNLAFALVTPLGALLFFFGAGHLAHSEPAWVGAALAFCAGTFLCIACADLLPELQFHSHDRVKLSLALLAGIGVALAIARFGHAEDRHQHEPGLGQEGAFDERASVCSVPAFSAAFRACQCYRVQTCSRPMNQPAIGTPASGPASFCSASVGMSFLREGLS